MAYQPTLPPPLRLVELETVGSTNDHARQLAREGHPAGLVVWAHAQTAGRGRRGNAWDSLPGNLFMSMLLRPRVALAQIGQLSLVAGVALANVLESFVPAKNAIRLKWPNDLLVNGSKVAGILVETEGQESPWAVVGIGVNIADAPEGAVSLRDLGVVSYEAAHVLELLSREILILSRKWERDGFDGIRGEWLQRAHKLGDTVSVRQGQGRVEGVFEGLDGTGALLLKTAGGRQVVNAGEVFA